MRTQEIREMEKRVEMYRRLLIWNIVFLLGLLCWGSVFGQNYHVRDYKKLQSSPYYTTPSQFIKTPNNKYAFISSTRFFSYLDSNGLGVKNIPFESNMSLNFSNTTLIQAKNRNHFLCSFSQQDSSTSGDIGVIKLNSAGGVLFKKLFRANNLDGNLELTQDTSGNIYLLALSQSDSGLAKTTKNYGQSDFWLIKLDSNGNILWQKNFGGTSSETYANIKITSTNDIIIAGYSYSGISGNKTLNNGDGYWVLKLDLNGNILKQNNFKINGIVNFMLSSTIIETKDKNYIFTGIGSQDSFGIYKLDTNLNLLWKRNFYGLASFQSGDIFHVSENIDKTLLTIRNTENTSLYDQGFIISQLDSNGQENWSQEFLVKSCFANTFHFLMGIEKRGDRYYIPASLRSIKNERSLDSGDALYLLMLEKVKHVIKGSTYSDFNSNCFYNKSNEFNIPNFIIQNKTEKVYSISNDSIYTSFLFDSDTAILKIINLDTNLYVACGKDSIVVNMTGKTDTSGIDFPIRSNKTGHCINITSFSSGLLRPGRWGDYQLNYQNNAFDTAYNAYIEIELDTAAIDSIKSPYSFTLIGNVLRFNLGHVRPFGFSSVTYSIKLKTTVIIGSSHCHRAKVFPICNLYPSTVYDSSEIQPMMRCLSNDTVEFTLKNIGIKDQKDWGHSIIYVDELILKKDSFKLTVGNSRVFKYKLDTNRVFTAEVFNSNFHPVTPILIRHNDLCANKRPMIPSNPALNFSRHDEAKEYEEACTIVRGSYDPNMKSVLPVGMFSQHYTATGTELKYRIDFQNTGTDTAFRVVLIDTLSSFLDIASFVPGVSSHPYSVEFGGRAVKFIFDPIRLIDNGTNEPASHGYVHFKINHKKGITPKTKIENFVDIYFDYNAPVRTNTVFNTIFDTIQIYMPKAADTVADTTGKVGIQGLNKTSILVFPNPTTDKFYLSMSEPVKNLSIEIFDMQGRLIKTASSSNNQTIEVSAQGMIKGIYHIRCMSGEKLIVVKKVMVE